MGPSVTGPAGQDATNHIHCDDGSGGSVDIYNPTILSIQYCIGTTMGSTVALVTPILPTFAAATGIGIVTSSAAVETHTLSNLHTFSAGTGLALLKTCDAHVYSNSAPVPMLNAGESATRQAP